LSIYIHKILPIFLLPVGLTLLLMLWGLLSRRRTLIWVGFVVLWLSGTPLIGNFMIRSVEAWGERIQAIDSSHADAIVVLSGGRLVAPGAERTSEWNDADRFFGGVELYLANKAPLLIFTGGWAPWEPKAKLEGDILIEYAKALGVPGSNMVTTGPVVNTDEEAKSVAALLAKRQIMSSDPAGQFSILLVTSAFHMQRAQRLFEQAGLKVIPFPVDFQVSEGRLLSVIDFLPGAGALTQTEIALRELYGRFFYWVKGLIISVTSSS
jgi:uncharacterized SAM-binding protein YcdF (DUF218 family)